MLRISSIGKNISIQNKIDTTKVSKPVFAPILKQNPTDVFESANKPKKSLLNNISNILFTSNTPLKAEKVLQKQNESKEIAEGLYQTLIDQPAAVDSEEFDEQFIKINTSNVVSVMKEFDKISPNMTLIGAICDEKANFSSTRKNAINKVVDNLVMAANKIGIQTPQYSNYFDQELDTQFDKILPVKVQQLDKITRALAQAIENKNSLTSGEKYEIKHADAKTTQTYTTKVLANAAMKAEKAMQQQAEYDGWSAKLGEKIRKLWNSKNQKSLVHSEINAFKSQIKDLSANIGKPEYNLKFKEIFGIDYDPELVAKCKEKEEKCIAATLLSSVSETFDSTMQDVLKNKTLQDNIYYPQMPKATPILKETRKQRYEKNLNKFAEFLGQGDIQKGKKQLEEVFAMHNVNSNTSLDEKYSAMRDIALNYSKLLAKNKNIALKNKTLKEIQNEYEGSYYAAFGIKNDVAKRVNDYRSSQMLSELLVQDAILCTASIPIWVCTSGTGIIPTLKIAGLQSAVDLSVYFSDRFSSKKGMTEEDLKDSLKWAGIDAATAMANMLSYKGIEAITSPIAKISGTAAQITDFALCTAADLAVDCGFEYIGSGKVTFQGVVYSLIFSSSGYIIDLKATELQNKKTSKNSAVATVAGGVPESNVSNKSKSNKMQEKKQKLSDIVENFLPGRTADVTQKKQPKNNGAKSLTDVCINILPELDPKDLV